MKGGKNVGREMLATLKGDMQREQAVSGILISLEAPTSAMKKEVADAGRWNSTLHPDRSFPVLQVITAQDLLDGKLMELPTWGLDTGGRAKKVAAKAAQSAMTFDDPPPAE
ncbi:MAG: hypothetical protein JNM85_08290 [Chthonomonas sp.]|nr:hypothetical protein [Chthonomonas sp.]